MAKRRGPPKAGTLWTAARAYVRERDIVCQYPRGFLYHNIIDRHQLPCNGGLECAHIIKRWKRKVKYDPENLAMLCTQHHVYLDGHPYLLMEWAEIYLGKERWEALKERDVIWKPTYAEAWEELRNLQAMRKAL